MAGGTIAAAVIGATSTAIATATSIASEAIGRSNSNLACAIEVWNGTAYDFNVSKTKFRKGALFGGTEGTFIESPGILGQQSFCVFSVEQVKGATTDIVGAVLFTSRVMDLLIGFHIYDQFGIQRYITAIPLKRGEGEKLFDEPWTANLDEQLNKYIWSGAGANNSYTTKDTEYRMFNFNGDFIRDIRERNRNGDLVATINGTPSIRQIDATGSPSFATLFTGGGQTMKATVSDDAFIDEIIDITGDWRSTNEGSTETFSASFVPQGVKISVEETFIIGERDTDSANKYITNDGYYEFNPKIAKMFDNYGKVVDTFIRHAETS